jgi:hypothetical protein
MYDQKPVRLRAIEINPKPNIPGVAYISGGSSLCDTECVEGMPPRIQLKPGEFFETFAGKHRAWESNSKPEIVEAYRQIWGRDQQVDITAIGVFYGQNKQGYGHHGGKKFQFVILKLEDARPVQIESVNR